MRCTGIPASPGIVVGKAFRWMFSQPVVERRQITEEEIEYELARLHQSLAKVEERLRDIERVTLDKGDEEQAGIFVAHREILQDPWLIDLIEERIRARKTASWAVQEAMEVACKELESVADPYIRERVTDIRDIGHQVLLALEGKEEPHINRIDDPVILVGEDFPPSFVAQLDSTKVLAICTDLGGPTGHTAILARSLRIPAVVGLRDLTDRVSDGQVIGVDGLDGVVYVSPEEGDLTLLRRKRQQYDEEIQRIGQTADRPALTRDGRRVQIMANLGGLQELDDAARVADGVGLFRTEFLFLDRSEPPSEEEQFNIYRTVLESFGNRPVVIRTLDIGGDKMVPYLRLPQEDNPFLGCRGIRLCLTEPWVFRVQLRALYRASVFGRLLIMFPMVSILEELAAAKELAGQVQDELRSEGISCRDVPIGIMVETPSAALLADRFVPYVDFFSIGTNDLVQYTMAADRLNDRVAHLRDPFQPSILRLIRHVAQVGHQAGKPVGVCGEMAGDLRAIPILVGMGVEELSMAPVSIPWAKDLVRRLDARELERYTDDLGRLDTAGDVQQLLSRIAKYGGKGEEFCS